MNAVKLILSLALVALVPAAAYATTADKAEFKKIADGVYAFVGKRNDANALVVVTTPTGAELAVAMPFTSVTVSTTTMKFPTSPGSSV